MPLKQRLPNGGTAYVPSPSEMTAAQQFALLNPNVNTLQDYQQAKIAVLAENLQQQYAQGFVSNAVNNTNITWPFDPTSQAKWSWLASILGAGGTFPTSIQVKDINNNVYAVTQTEAQALVSAATAFYLEWDGHYHTQMDSVNSAATIPAVLAVGW